MSGPISLCRTSPAEEQRLRLLAAHPGARVGFLAEMAVTLDLGGDRPPPALCLADASFLPRLTVKGPPSTLELLLAGAGLALPARVGTTTRSETRGTLVARTGGGEVMVEAGLRNLAEASGAETSASGPLGYLRAAPSTSACLVLERPEAIFEIAGADTFAALSEVCALDPASFEATAGPVGQAFALTRLAGVSGMLLRRPSEPARGPRFALAVDPSYGEFLAAALLEVVTGLGGAAVGTLCLYPEAAALSSTEPGARTRKATA